MVFKAKRAQKAAPPKKKPPAKAKPKKSASKAKPSRKPKTDAATQAIVEQAQVLNTWWNALSAKPPAERLAAVSGPEREQFEAARAFGGYPWRMTYRQVSSAYRALGDYRGFCSFEAATFANAPPNQEDEYFSMLSGFEGFIQACLEANDLDRAREILAFMSGPELSRFGAPLTRRIADLKARVDAAGGDFDAALAHERAKLEFSTFWEVHLNIARLLAKKGAFDEAVTSLQEVYRQSPSKRREVEARPEFAPLIASPAYAKAFPAVQHPTDPVLAKAWRQATDSPWQVYERLEAHRGKTTDLLDLLGVQLYCLSIICDDLDEHGTANLEEYGGRKRPVKSYFDLKATTAKALTAEKRRSGREVPFYAYRGWAPR